MLSRAGFQLSPRSRLRQALLRGVVRRAYEATNRADYEVAFAGGAHGLHEATLATFHRIFGDVRPTSEIIALLEGRDTLSS